MDIEQLERDMIARTLAEVKPEPPAIRMEHFHVVVVLQEPQLGTIPRDPDTYSQYIATRAPSIEAAAEELATVPDSDISGQAANGDGDAGQLPPGWTTFHRDASGIFIYNYMVMGFLKAAGKALRDQHGVAAVASKIDQLVRVRPRRLRFYRPDYKGLMVPITEPEGSLVRSLRASTPQGPRNTIVTSDLVEKQATAGFWVSVIEQTDTGKKKIVDEKLIRMLFEYGDTRGLGQWRNADHGRFKAYVNRVSAVPAEVL